ncbi:MAG TPA: transglutaminase-like domain-containing protein [Solirubrobacterales bacterium]|nr:transglutaminase-like domain-containing protein [Solirubrobacterales bacterium]
MARTAASPEPRRADAAALLLLSAGGAAAWWSAFGTRLLWLAPVIAVAALTAGGALRTRPAALVALAWVPGALLAAGLPVGVLAPGAWDTTVAALRDGIQGLPTIATVTPVIQAWALAAVLLIGGTATGLAGILWRGDGWERSLVGFVLLLVPLGSALAMQQTPDAAWQGAIVLVAVVLRIARGRLVPIVATASMVGAVALFGAQVAAPRAGWQPFGHPHHLSQFHELDTAQTYGPLDDRRTGAVMLDVTSHRPALWQMQVLEAFDNRRWLAAREDSHLPEPAAHRQTVKVEVRGLRNRLIVSPGRIDAVSGTHGVVMERGGGEGLMRTPSEGDTYRVEADTVHVRAARLARIPVPTGRRYQALTQIGLEPPPRYIPYPLSELAKDLPEPLRGTDWGRLFRLAFHLSRGVGTELAMVHRVENFLLADGRYHYTTDVGSPGMEPLMEFLFQTHQGYCQHFAGAAALLLRVTGVPTRVVVGFATGEQIGKDTWAVRDEDAHAWIQVYFPGVGWVPFNPTPVAAPADVSPGLDLFQAGSTAPTGAGGGIVGLVGGAALLLLLILGGARLARRRHGPRTRLADLLVRLAPEPSGPRTTLRSLHPRLTEIGPATAALALVAEQARFAAAAPAEPAHPGLTVWRALVADVGLRRSLGLMLRAASSAARGRTAVAPSRS